MIAAFSHIITHLVFTNKRWGWFNFISVILNKFTQQIFIAPLPRVRYFSKCLGYGSEQSRMISVLEGFHFIRGSRDSTRSKKKIKSVIQFIEGDAWYGKQNKWDWVGEIRSTRRFNLGWSGEALLRRRHLRSKGDEGVSHASFHRKSAPGEGKASAKATDEQEVQSFFSKKCAKPWIFLI